MILQSLQISIFYLVVDSLWTLRAFSFIILGLYYRKHEEGIKFSYLFTIVGLIDILWQIVYPRIGSIVLFASEDYELYYRIMWTFGPFLWFLHLIPYGIAFIFIGFKNLRNSEYFFKLSGLSLCIGGIITLISLVILDFPAVFDLDPHKNIVIVGLATIFYLGASFNIIAPSLLLAYAIKLVDIKFGVIALLFLFERIISFILYFYIFSTLYF